MTNIIARPDISVSRINARHIAVNPNPALVGTDGHHFLDGNSNPQTVESATPLYTDPEQLDLFNFRDSTWSGDARRLFRPQSPVPDRNLLKLASRER